MKVIARERRIQQYESAGIKVPSIPADVQTKWPKNDDGSRMKGLDGKALKMKYPCGFMVYPTVVRREFKTGRAPLIKNEINIVRYYIADGEILHRPRKEHGGGDKKQGRTPWVAYIYDILTFPVEKAEDMADAILRAAQIERADKNKLTAEHLSRVQTEAEKKEDNKILDLLGLK